MIGYALIKIPKIRNEEVKNFGEIKDDLVLRIIHHEARQSALVSRPLSLGIGHRL